MTKSFDSYKDLPHTFDSQIRNGNKITFTKSDAEKMLTLMELGLWSEEQYISGLDLIHSNDFINHIDELKNLAGRITRDDMSPKDLAVLEKDFNKAINELESLLQGVTATLRK